MPAGKTNPAVRHKAVTKYKRLRTIVSKILQFDKLCALKLNLIIYDEKLNKIQEIYTHEDAKMSAIT